MGYRIEGDGTWQNTVIWKDGEVVDAELCEVQIDIDRCEALVDGVSDKLDRLVISAIYMVISDGDFKNTKVLFCDEMLRGVQALGIVIEKGKHPYIYVKAVLMPNLIEFKEE